MVAQFYICGDAVTSTVASRHACSGFEPLCGVCTFSMCLRGFSPSTPASSHSPFDMSVHFAAASFSPELTNHALDTKHMSFFKCICRPLALGFSPKCVRLCFFMGQLYGRSPVWMRRCRLRFPLWLKLLEQKVQRCGLSPVCVRRCRRRSADCAKDLQHQSQAYVFLFCSRWRRRLLAWPNASPQRGHPVCIHSLLDT
uniref:Uncharacterized protein n=1 Tax=Monopterus albus TaxID=43700 RepID=A0A3Q3IIU9_MONAL